MTSHAALVIAAVVSAYMGIASAFDAVQSFGAVQTEGRR